MFTTWWNKIGKEKRKPEKSMTTSPSKPSWLHTTIPVNDKLNSITSVGDIFMDPKSGDMSVYTSNGTWSTIADSTTISDPYITTSPVTGVQVTGDLTVNGRNVMEELDIIKTLLDGAVLQRDPAMEEEFGKLKALADEYQKQLEKYKTFKALKESA